LLFFLQDNERPIEEGSNLEPDGNTNTSIVIVHVCSGNTKCANISKKQNSYIVVSENSSVLFALDHGDPDLTFALFGSSEAVHFGCDNILLGEKKPCLKNTEFPMSIPIQRKISEHLVSVINMICSHKTDLKPLDNDIGHRVNESEIHAFVFVVRLGQLTDEEKMGIEWLQRMFGDRVLSFVIILFTYEREEEPDTIIDDLKNNSVLAQLVEKCGGRYHICSKNMNNQSEMRELIDKIKQLFIDNNQQFYTREMYKPSGDLQDSESQSGNTDRMLIFCFDFLHLPQIHFNMLIRD